MMDFRTPSSPSSTSAAALAELVVRASDQLSDLVAAEAALARAEVRRDVKRWTGGGLPGRLAYSFALLSAVALLVAGLRYAEPLVSDWPAWMLPLVAAGALAVPALGFLVAARLRVRRHRSPEPVPVHALPVRSDGLSS